MTLAATLLAAGVLALWWLLQQDTRPLLERVRAQGELVVATRKAPAVLYKGANGTDGFEHALTQKFAETIGVKVRYVFPETVEELLDAVARGTVHFAGAGLVVTPAREHKVRFSVPYQFATEQLIYRRGSMRPRSLDQVAPGDLHVVANSSHEETLASLQARDYPMLDWTRHPHDTSRALLAAVDRGEIRLTMANSNSLALHRRIFRHVASAFELGDPWATTACCGPRTDSWRPWSPTESSHACAPATSVTPSA